MSFYDLVNFFSRFDSKVLHSRKTALRDHKKVGVQRFFSMIKKVLWVSHKRSLLILDTLECSLVTQDQSKKHFYGLWLRKENTGNNFVVRHGDTIVFCNAKSK